MSALFERRKGVVAEALSGCAPKVKPAGRAEWSVGNTIRVRWDEPWLAFEARANGAGRDGRSAGWDLLRGQGALPASCRYALSPSGELVVVAEVACEEAVDLGAQCRDVVRGLQAARKKRPLRSPRPGRAARRKRRARSWGRSAGP